MISFRYNDGGRSEAGYRGDTGDCVCRATAILAGADYKELYKRYADLHHKRHGTRTARNGINKADYERVFKQLGLEKVKLGRGPKPTFTEAWEQFGDCIVTTTRHICAIVDGALQDTEDIRVYDWLNDNGSVETNERKARSIWIPAT